MADSSIDEKQKQEKNIHQKKIDEKAEYQVGQYQRTEALSQSRGSCMQLVETFHSYPDVRSQFAYVKYTCKCKNDRIRTANMHVVIKSTVSVHKIN